MFQHLSTVLTRVDIEHIGNLRILLQLGWIQRIRGNRPTPRMNEVKFRDKGELMQMREELLLSMKDPEAFIEKVIGSRDPIWVDRCSLIIAEY